jgi:O-succinylbenzoic acid--CoA ligase
VSGRPDPEWGQRVVATVVPGDRTAPPTLEALREHVKASLPAYAAPTVLDLVDALPRTSSGKVRRP